eukprot:scaffold43745_cov229-Amphora_coffeaeformis.AAC.3
MNVRSSLPLSSTCISVYGSTAEGKLSVYLVLVMALPDCLLRMCRALIRDWNELFAEYDPCSPMALSAGPFHLDFFLH